MKFQHLFLITVVLLSLPLHGVAQAQETQERPIVKLIYFLPNDRAPQPDFDAKMDTLIKNVQARFANQMEAHGFDRKTFLFETDTRGKAVVHHFIGQFTEEYYNNLSSTWNIFEEINKQFDTSKDIYVVAVDTSRERVINRDIEVCGTGGRSGVGGRALVPAAGRCFGVGVIAHELGHVFGLWHGFYNDIDSKRIFSYTSDFMLASFWAADWWDVHPAFNPPRPTATNEYQRPTVEMLAPSLAAGPNVIRLRFEITDPNERLHQAQLMTSRPGDVYFLAGQRLNGKPNEIVEFVTPHLTRRDQNVWLQMIDAHGNITQSQQFPIDITPLLPPSEIFATAPLNKGSASRVAYSPDGQRLAVTGGLGVWLYDTKKDVPPVLIENPHTGSISFSPDGQTLATVDLYRLVRLWDVRTREPGRTLQLPAFPSDISFSPDGRLLAIAGWNCTLYLWDVMTGEFRHTIERAHLGHCLSVSFSPDGQTLASVGTDRLVRLWDVGTAELRQTLHVELLGSVTFSPDGKTLTSASFDGTVRLWDVMTGELRQTITTDVGSLWTGSFSPDGKTLANGMNHTGVRLWDVSTGELRHTLHGHTTLIESVAFSPDGKTLASVSPHDSTVNIWNVMTGERRQELTGYSNSIQSMSFSPDSETLATVGAGKTTIDMWDVSTDALRQTLTGHTRPVNTVSFSPDGKTIASAASDSTVRLWDVSTGALRQTLTGDADFVNIVSFSPDGKTIVSADDNLSGTDKKVNIYLWDVMTGERRHTLIGHTYRVIKVSFSPDGKTLTSVSLGDDTIRVWDVTTGELHHTNPLIGYKGRWIAGDKNTSFSPDGKMFACVSGDPEWKDWTNTIYLWDVMTGELRQELTGHTDDVPSISFSPDGKTLASASDDSTICLWDAMTGERRHTLIGYASWISSVSFSPDGKTLASGGLDEQPGANNTVYLWDAESGKHRHTLTTGTHLVLSVLFSPDGQTLAIAGIDGTFSLWKVPPTSPQPGENAADVNGDGVVNIKDLVAVNSALLTEASGNNADVNQDGIINIADLVLVAAAIATSEAAVAAAPAVIANQAAKQLTPADVQQWLIQAQHARLTDATSQRGILFLQYLLAALTPQETGLLQNYPNPFNPETWIPYQLAKPAAVTLIIYAVDGKLVRTLDLGHQPVGSYQNRSRAAYWDGRNEIGEPVASGVYFYMLKAGTFTATRKMLILK